MRRTIWMLGAILVTACGQSADNQAGNAAVAQAAAKKAKPAYCFFKDPDTKGWSASADKTGNVVVKGKAYRQDPRYMAVLGSPVVTGTSAEVSPSVTVNSTGYAAPENWWDVSTTIPNSAAVETVTVRCGSKVLAELKVPRKA